MAALSTAPTTPRRRWRRAAAVVAWLLAAGLGLVAVQAQRRPSLAPWRALELPPAPAHAPVSVRFAGVSTLLFDDGETAWMTDGFYSRPGMARTLFGRIAPDEAVVARELDRLGVTRLAAVVPLHSHYDHALDAPIVARRTGALLVGSRSTLNVGLGLGLAPAQLREVRPGDSLQLGRFRLTFIAARHGVTAWSDGSTVETIDAPLVPPAHASAWREGQAWSLRVDHASGLRLLVHASAGWIAGALDGQEVDTVFLGLGGLGRRDAAARADYWSQVVRASGARRVVAIHWDDIWRPLEQPLAPLPLLFDDAAATLDDLVARARSDGIAFGLPPLRTPFAPWTAGGRAGAYATVPFTTTGNGAVYRQMRGR